VKIYFSILLFIFFSNVLHADVLESSTLQKKDIHTNAIPNTIDVGTDTQSSIALKQKYRVGVSFMNGYPLHAFENKADKGLAWAILEKFAEDNNIEFEYVAMPVSRLQHAMDIGDIDFVFPDNPTWSPFRSNHLPNIYSASLFSTLSATFVRAENRLIKTQNVSKVAIPFGYPSFIWVKPIRSYKIRSVPVRDLRTALFSVDQGSVDAADVEYNIGQHLLFENPSLSNLTIAPNLPSTAVEYHLSTIKHIRVLENLSNFMVEEKVLMKSLKEQYGLKYHHEVYQRQD
jgi:hypothetical protein